MVREFFQKLSGRDFVFGHFLPNKLLADVDEILLSLHYFDLGYFELMLIVFYLLNFGGLDIGADVRTNS